MGPFFTSSVAVRIPRTSASCAAGSDTPARSSARTAVANSLRTSRGGSVTQRVMARSLPAARCREVELQRLDRVEVALGERIQASGCRAESVEQRDLDQVVPRVAPRRIRAPRPRARSRGERIGPHRRMRRSPLDQVTTSGFSSTAVIARAAWYHA